MLFRLMKEHEWHDAQLLSVHVEHQLALSSSAKLVGGPCSQLLAALGEASSYLWFVPLLVGVAAESALE